MDELNDKQFLIDLAKHLNEHDRIDGNIVMLSDEFAKEVASRLLVIAAGLKEGE